MALVGIASAAGPQLAARRVRPHRHRREAAHHGEARGRPARCGRARSHPPAEQCAATQSPDARPGRDAGPSHPARRYRPERCRCRSEGQARCAQGHGRDRCVLHRPHPGRADDRLAIRRQHRQGPLQRRRGAGSARTGAGSFAVGGGERCGRGPAAARFQDRARPGRECRVVARAAHRAWEPAGRDAGEVGARAQPGRRAPHDAGREGQAAGRGRPQDRRGELAAREAGEPDVGWRDRPDSRCHPDLERHTGRLPAGAGLRPLRTVCRGSGCAARVEGADDAPDHEPFRRTATGGQGRAAGQHEQARACRAPALGSVVLRRQLPGLSTRLRGP